MNQQTTPRSAEDRAQLDRDVRLADVAAEFGWSYQTAWLYASRGAFGPVRREGGRIIVSRSGVDAFRVRSEKPVVKPNGADPLASQADLTAMCRDYHIAGCSQVAILDHFRAELLVAQAAGDVARAELIEQALEHLPSATYERAPGGAWTVHVAGQSQTSRPSEPNGERS